MAEFVHLHLHSEYSMLDGFIRFEDLAELARKYHMSSVALTDHGALFGMVPFYKVMSNHGIKPIIGMEAYISPGSRFDKKRKEGVEGYAFHLLLLAMDDTGLKNLQKLSSLAYLEGFYYKPRIDKELLEKYSEGLIACSACLHGEIPYYFLRGEDKKAREIAETYLDIFGKDRFYLEIMENGLEEQRLANEKLIELSKKMGIKVIATQDVHYLRPEDAKIHEVLLCIQTGSRLTDEKRFKFQSDEFYFRSPEEIERLFSHIPEAVKNTLEVAEKCNVELKFGHPHFPRFELPHSTTPEEYLREQAVQGLKNKMKELDARGEKVDEKEYFERLDYEIQTINQMGFAAYFLIVADIVRYARENAIPMGPGRGSAVGSLVSYALGITDIDPIKYGLIFERFLNPARVTMPDVDLDFCKLRRDEIIEYVRQRYGEDHVAFVGTFQRIKAKQALRDVCRAYGVSAQETEKLAKLIPDGINSLREAIVIDGPFKEKYEKNQQFKEIVDTAVKIEGVVRQAGTHPGGVVITPEPAIETIPICVGKNNLATTQIDKNGIDLLGYVKFDLLSLDTITAIYECLHLIEKTRGLKLSINDIPLDDRETYESLARGDTEGVFQLSGAGITELVKKLKPEKLSDLIAVVALFRPGPLQSGVSDEFIQRKHGRKPVTYLFPALKEALEETYGLMIYQEQVMKIAQIVAGFSMSEADELRRAISKKIPEKMEELGEKFITGGVKRGFPREKVEALYESIRKFAEYAFNKSHSASYAYLSYITAYLKTHYTVEYFAALLNASLSRPDDVIRYLSAARGKGIKILSPDVNKSERTFTVEEGCIRFALEAIKQVGVSAIEEIIKVRSSGPFKDLADFVKRVDKRKVNRRVIESLIKAGAFDFTGLHRSQLMEMLERVISIYGKNSGTSSQISIFSSDPVEPEVEIPSLEEWPESELLKYEKEALGFYLSGHPLEKLWPRMKPYLNATVSSILDGHSTVDEVIMGGIFTQIRPRKSRRGNLTALGFFEDLTGSIEVLLFEDHIKSLPENYHDKPFFVRARVEDAEGERRPKLVISQIIPVEEAPRRLAKTAHIRMSTLGVGDEEISRLKEILISHRGSLRVFVYLKFPEGFEAVLKLPEVFGVSFSTKLVEKLKNELDAEVYYSS